MRRLEKLREKINKIIEKKRQKKVKNKKKQKTKQERKVKDGGQCCLTVCRARVEKPQLVFRLAFLGCERR